jgi:hypothetical protein
MYTTLIIVGARVGIIRSSSRFNRPARFIRVIIVSAWHFTAGSRSAGCGTGFRLRLRIFGGDPHDHDEVVHGILPKVIADSEGNAVTS